MSASLLDVNLLVGLLDEDSLSHVVAQQWFLRNSRKGWATCPFTQAAFVRIVCNPAASRIPVRPAQAVEVLEENLKHPAHEFWPDDISFAEAVAPFRRSLTGHQQITDAYLLGLAHHRKGRLVTLDRGVAALASAAGLGSLVTLLSS